MFKTYKALFAIFVCIALQSCAKDSDLISEYVILNDAKTEYRSTETQKMMNLNAPIEKMETASLISFAN